MRKLTSWTITDILVFLMTWVYFTLNARYLNFSGSHILRWVFPILLVLGTFSRYCGKIVKPPVFLVFFCISVIPSLIVSIDNSTSIQKFCSFVLILYGSYIFFMGLRSIQELEQCIYIFSIVVVIFQVLNILCMLLGVGYDGGRASGITTNSNTLGIYSNIAFGCAVFLITAADTGLKKIFYSFIAISAVLSAIASGSRSAFVIIAVNLIVFGYIKFHKSPVIIPFIGGIIVVVYLLLTGGLSFLNITALERFAEHGTDRGDLWEIGIATWHQYEMFGCGYTVSSQINSVAQGLQFHNSYLSFLVECGIWGAVFLGMGMFGIAFKVLRNLRTCSNNLRLGSFLVACMIVVDLAVSAYGESFMFAVGSTEGFTFWFLIAWILAYINQLHYEESAI